MRVLLYALLVLIGAVGGYFVGAHQRAPAPVNPGEPRPAVQPTPVSSNKSATLDMEITDGGSYRVRKVLDGDSVILENGVRVCYHGVRAPEMGHYVKDAAPMAAEATQRNAELVEGKQVKLTLAKDPFDIHGRVLARVTLQRDATEVSAGGETDVGSLLIKEGFARSFGLGMAPDEYRDLKQLEETARLQKVGLWSLEDKVRAEMKNGKPYCASGSSSLYHLATCPLAKRIHAENRHEYATMDEAEEAGKNPCRKCVTK